MLTLRLGRTLAFAAGLTAIASSSVTPDVIISARSAPGMSVSDTYQALGRALYQAKVMKRKDVFKNSTSIAKSWVDATLFSFEHAATKDTGKGNITTKAGIAITCSTCYVKAKATAQLTVDGDFNVTTAFHNVTDQIVDEFENVTTTVVQYFSNVATKLSDGFDPEDFALPPIGVDFEIDMPPIPESTLSFQFDDLELYVQLDTVLNGAMTYSLNLYTSNSPIGVSVGDSLQAGVFFTIDLVLSAEAEIDISSGFHIKLDDGVALEIALFGKNVSDTTFNGGTFEFLPVTIKGASGVLKAVLQLGVTAGFNLDPPSSLPNAIFDVSAGVMVGVFATIAEFTTNITAAPAGDDSGCALRVEETYQLAVGAAAGATVAIGDHTWGPTPNTTIPVFYTTIAAACASTKTVTATTTASLAARADGNSLTVKTLTTPVTFTGVQCLSTGLVICPASLQITAITSSIKSLITTVPSGIDPTFPDSVLSSVPSTIAFGTAANGLISSTGAPTSFVPSPSADPSGPLGFINGVDKRIIIGVSAGVGGALLLAIIGCCFASPSSYSSGYGQKKEPMVHTRVDHAY
ncbi:hypothetical protein JX265_002072 [Neoarthrinium moseri]|uniref:Mid2 domain-containing protein n=1 Tax=Neoarthrinium moseri TaxID=1658444 RepID=A0A9P9WWU1_9PEZI|nr:hypothetical protein JX266_006181 [Neoarthrinium moseri]KAI1880451.1 hypothetical protein JX265_002072 [Neoarthrinium moseri]